MSEHRDLILEQFTRQAGPFSSAPAIRDEAALGLVVRFTGAGANDTALDVACGPGLLVVALARVVRHAIGIDLTPAMLERAQAHAAAQRVLNVSWARGDALALPCADGVFTIVLSRFAFHHLPDPRAALTEMKRVCASGGKVVVVDSAPDPAKADAFNDMERLRDPSHVRAMPLAEIRDHFRAVGLSEPRTTSYRLEGELEELLRRSFPKPGAADRIRQLFAASLADDALGVAPRREGGQIRYGYPVGVLAADR